MRNKLFKFFKSTFGIIIILFIIWMIFFDTNSLRVHIDLTKEINKLNNQKTYYKDEITKDRKELNMLQTDSGIEKYARENLYMKKDNEDIYLIEFDTISK
tara:strand:+ start:127 stop:426 length:300 start_codon:yes stop_codon:yes gene_type:complete